MSQILKDLNKLAAKMGAPVVGRNISEQVRAISTYYEGTTHGANIAERINEVRHAWHEGSEPATLIEKSIIQNGTYSARYDNADGYSSVNVDVIPDYSFTGFENFSTTSNCYALSNAYDWDAPFEIQVCALPMVDPDDWPSNQYLDLIGNWDNLAYSNPCIEVRPTEIRFVPPNTQYSSAVEFIKYTFTETPFVKGRPIWIRGSYDGGAVNVGKYAVSMSLDKQSFTEIANGTISASMVEATSPICFGGRGVKNQSNTSIIMPYMNLIFSECYVKLNGNYVWGHA